MVLAPKKDIWINGMGWNESIEQSAEINPHMYDQLNFYQGGKNRK